MCACGGMEVVVVATPVTKSAHMYFVMLVSRAEVRIRNIGCDMRVLIGIVPVGLRLVIAPVGLRLGLGGH